MSSAAHHPSALPSWRTIVASALMALVLAWSLVTGLRHAHGHEGHAPGAPPLWALGSLPFALLLLAIAILPLVPATATWWNRNANRLLVSLLLGVAAVAYLVAAVGAPEAGVAVKHALVDEYAPFIVLLFCLYVITGGICLQGNLPATPAVNTGFLAIGALLASVLGTTGASMLLIRPLLQTNQERAHKVHTVVFFIFLVSNVGGTLLPVGDPPLFIGYLRGIPFFWTLELWPAWAMACVVLLVVYFLWDCAMHRRERPEALRIDAARVVPERMSGSINFLWLLGVLLAVAFINPSKPLPGTDWTPFPFLRELLMLGFTGLSLLTTPERARRANQFNYHAINEVAALFIGIFITMQIPVMVLRVHGESLGLTEPWHYFWATGILSSFLDNAPTYAVFFEAAAAASVPGAPGNVPFNGGEIDAALLTAVSLGAVFMGANTYIGNGPNFMVKSIAESAGVRMPGFFRYMLYSLAVLIPLFVAVTLVRL